MKQIGFIISFLLLSVNLIAQKYVVEFTQVPAKSSSIVTLYRNTLETLHVNIYEEGNGSVKGADVQIIGGDLISWENDTMKLIPTKAKITFIFSKAGKKLALHTLSAHSTPKPEVYLASGEQMLKSTISLASLRKLKIVCKVDQGYVHLHPNESNMKVHKATYFVERRGIRLMIGDWKSQFQKNISRMKTGDKLIIQIDSYQTKAWDGQTTILKEKSPKRLEVEVN